jgi:circadian clock protein KaiB
VKRRAKAERRPKNSHAKKKAELTYELRLYITGQTPLSMASIRNVRALCDQCLAGRFELKIVDLYQQPELAKQAQIVAAPTLIKLLPLPLRRLVGDLSDEKRVRIALDLDYGDDASSKRKS